MPRVVCQVSSGICRAPAFVNATPAVADPLHSPQPPSEVGLVPIRQRVEQFGQVLEYLATQQIN